MGEETLNGNWIHDQAGQVTKHYATTDAYQLFKTSICSQKTAICFGKLIFMAY